MEKKFKKENISSTDDENKSAVSEQILGRIKEILTLFSKTVSATKIFLPDHASVKKMVKELWEKLDSFLEEHEKLQIDIQEFSFHYEDHMVFQDDKTIKSLPFLFYKDGMQTLYFYKGLKQEELQELMEIIKRVYELPAEESDIVNLLWEKDFANIRYFAPDEFLETKIGAGKEPMDIQVDKEPLFTGSIELRPEDKKALQQRQRTHSVEKAGPYFDNHLPDDRAEGLNAAEHRTLEAMLAANRQVSPEEELVLLVSEILNLEEDTDRFKGNLEAVPPIHQDFLQKGEFAQAHKLLSHLFELKLFFSYQGDPKANIIDDFLMDTQSQEEKNLINKALMEGKVEDFGPFFAYMELRYGQDAAPILGELYDRVKTPEFQQEILQFVKEKAEQSPKEVMRIVNDERPELTRHFISILRSIPEHSSVQSLAPFIRSRDTSIKAEAIKALGQFKDPTANKILLGFLSDKDEQLRILAAQNIMFVKEDSIVQHVKNMVFSPEFRNKSKQEKQSILNILGRNKTKDTYDLLEQILIKPKFLWGIRHTETRLCAVQTLENMGSPEAHRLLKRGSRMRNRKIRLACKQALQNLSKANTQE